jgi:hypothetical protein
MEKSQQLRSKLERAHFGTSFICGYGIGIVGETVCLDASRHVIRPNKEGRAYA